ncbi:hypothetical protein GCM10011507_34180 [Edaphobacter acidisoli]|uniref:Outer membrane protein beta-barrel domain-containing protein n=1 Tax=Edaphobacter acidisoli TaxID=2040573 RepID=A0A916W9Y8_9BACT|nr:outer membrane beta-barrel protein [Edaphobacter acidisoli]GGA80083.1 hypothetical protein GCM10011507_34180 [Edaphobacter acidisoli]
MNRTILILILEVFLASIPVKSFAQAVPTASAPGASVSVGGTFSVGQSGYGQRVLSGSGAYVDVNPRRQVGIEAEGRWLQHDRIGKTSESTYLIGPRIQIRQGRLSPYVKSLVGLGYFGFPYNSAQGRYFVIATGTGVDLNLNETVKIRLVDIEYQRWPQFTFGTITPYTISFGFSYRLCTGSHTRLGAYDR